MRKELPDSTCQLSRIDAAQLRSREDLNPVNTRVRLWERQDFFIWKAACKNPSYKKVQILLWIWR